MEKKDYKDTLNLPKTSFPMRGNLPKKEKEILKYWNEIDLYNKLLESHKYDRKFVLHDGPPYANGHIHIGHALNKILKDIVVKSKSMQGYQTPFVPGWDCHGLPIERAVFQKLKKRKDEVDPIDVRKKCREYATNWVNIQREEFIRLGVIGDWKNPYITMDPKYQADIVRELGKFYERGLVHRAKKPVYWCPNCVTALAEAEIEYADEVSPSIYVAFKIINDKGINLPENTYLVIWTTTPWTLPANVAVAVNPELEYVVLNSGEKHFIIAKSLLEDFREKTDLLGETVKTFKGIELEGIKYEHPFIDREGQVTLADYVAADTGTGLVHIAPGHGEEDYQVGLKYNLPVLVPVDDYGKFTDEAPSWLKGLKIWEANPVIIKRLKEIGALLFAGEINHSYPHCWRCKGKVIFRATPQWFIVMDKGNPTLREVALKEIDKVQWIPEWGKTRIKNMVEGRPDWCISRQRIWGVPIVAFYCEECGETIYSKEIADYVANIFEKESADAWYKREAKELLPEGFKCPKCGGEKFKKEMDILDVWFDSGSSHAAVLERRPELSWPADMYLEGSDQHRGWFQASLLESCGTRKEAPYKSVLTHGFTLDEKGHKMSKSLGNVVAPEDVVKKFGADILRLWVASENFTEDVKISENILKQVAEVYKKIRNTFRFMLGNLSDFTPEESLVYDELEEIDKWAINRFSILAKEIIDAYNSYKFNKIYRLIYDYCATELSSIYLDILKDTLYCEAPNSKKRKSAQTAIYKILYGLTTLIAPILSFTAEEIYSYIPGREKESVFLEEFPLFCESPDGELLERWEKLMKVKSLVNKALEKARAHKMIGHSLEASITVYVDGELREFLERYKELLPYIFITSGAEVKQFAAAPSCSVGDDEILKGVRVKVKKAEGQKCERCWMYSTTVGQDSEFPDVCERCARVLREISE
ncbi:Isoleucyl-tRNA synthetase [Desulfurobacterium thermolithotrophum DSM 11699]|uniref:Isoleucine--tRNA ligase n=1 Tax=Desulfurobacterium thermolithotrophum (strain DSM 11699 / BSA) TaxID=868864 RepID=F0S367_DESTD|nr:isoleucine--tRNA ligase [Desulfurobacterium thermolithotrophum]ADY73289.1 Isoleucyl-tRNA synthetase [Desulfurobacterium thermolithotrophum DSM 11699]